MKSIPSRYGFLVLLLALIAPATSLAATEAPRDLIIRTAGELVDALEAQREAIRKDRKIGYRLAEQIIVPHVDFERIGRWVLGKHWRRANSVQRETFVREFRQLLMHTYVTAMVEYVDQIINHAPQVRYLPVRARPEDTQVTVKTEIGLQNRPPVAVDYSLIRNGNNWKIYDVSVEGISLVTTYRSSFGSQISRSSLDALLDELQEKNRKSADGLASAATP